MKNKSVKSLVAVDVFGNYSEYSVEEMLALRLNNWKDWDCSAGYNSLHITSDGNIFKATCKVDGYLGNVFDTGVVFPQHWAKCDKEWCMCGSDMQLPKSRSGKFESVELKVKVPDLKFFETVDLAPHCKIENSLKTITWDIGRRCNYHCSYCPPSTSNDYESHKSWSSLQQAADLLILGFCRGKRGRWIFTGGEPTINPNFMTLAKYLSEEFRHGVFTQTNGSRPKEYLMELLRYSSIGFSVHLQEANLPKLSETILALAAYKVQTPEMQRRTINVRIMVAPGHFSTAKSFYDQLLADANRDAFNLQMSPLYRANDGERLMDYSAEELELIVEYA